MDSSLRGQRRLMIRVLISLSLHQPVARPGGVTMFDSAGRPTYIRVIATACLTAIGIFSLPTSDSRRA